MQLIASREKKEEEVNMTNGEFMELLITNAKQYRASGIAESIRRNQHMHQWHGTDAPEALSDAILTDFLNFVGSRRGMDLGLYAHDLKPTEKENP